MSILFTKGNNDFRSFTTSGNQTNDREMGREKGSQELAPRLVSNTPTIDIVNNFPWTLTPLNSLSLQETPYIKLKEFYLLDSYINQAFQAYGIRISNIPEFLTAVGTGLLYSDVYDTNRLYQGLYDHRDETGFVYKLPYFSREYLQTSNSWVAKPYYNEIVELQQKVVGYIGTTTNIGTQLLQMGTNIAILALSRNPAVAALRQAAVAAGFNIFQSGINVATRGAQAAYKLKRIQERVKRGFSSPIGGIDETDPSIDKPHIWNNTTPRSFNISFPLYNTLTQPETQNNKWNEQILKNWEFCYLLTYQNLYNKRNLFSGIPPVFYEIDIPGIHYTKAAYIQNLRISNVGNIRSMTLPIDGTDQIVNVPDAYLINFTITDFFMPSKNFMSSIGKTDKDTLDDSIEHLIPPPDISDVSQYRPPNWRYQNPLDPLPEGIPGITDLPPAPPIVPSPDLFGG